MCDPVSLLVGAAVGLGASKLMTPKTLPGVAAAQPDPAAERAQAEAEAVQKANAKLASDQRRRREQGVLMARGAPAAAPAFTLGDESAAINDNQFGTTMKPTTRGTPAQRLSLVERGAPNMGSGGGGGYGGFSRNSQNAV